MKRRATSSENRKFFVAVVKKALSRIGRCQEDVDQWRIREIVVGVCWFCKSGKGLLCEAGGLAMDLGTCCLIRSSRR